MRKIRKHQEVVETKRIPPEVKEALSIGLEIIRVIEEDINDLTKYDHEEFFNSVLDKAKGISKTIKTNNKVTERQRNALENLLTAVQKWVHDD